MYRQSRYVIGDIFLYALAIKTTSSRDRDVPVK